MPLVRFQVRNEYGLGSEELYKEANIEEPKAILDGVAVAGLVGILRQLGDLAEFAAEVFHGLQEQVVTTASRSHKMLVRVQNIEAALPALEKAVMAQKSHIHFAYTAGCEWHPKIRVKQKHFIHSDLPNFILDCYEECHEPPRLHLLDRFDTGGPGACLRRYSDPSFFRKSISRSEPMKTEKVQREKRIRKSKKRSTRWRNGELSHAVSTSQCSGRMQFGSPNSYGQSSTAETISTIHMKSRSEQGEGSLSFDSRTRTGYVDCVFEVTSSVQQEDDEHNRLPTATLETQDGSTTDSVHPNEHKIDDNMARESLQHFNSSSVTWEEKTEIVDSKNHQSDTVVGDESVAPELLQESADLAKELSEATIQCNMDPEDIICVTADIPDSLSEVDEFDDAGSEPDKYADARNTLESESETDSECQTKREVEKPSATSINGVETAEACQKPEMPSVDFDTAPYSSSNKQMSPIYSNWPSSEDGICIQPPGINTIRSDPDISVDIGLSEGTDLLKVSKVDGCESSVSDPPSSLSSLPNSQPPPCGKIISTLYESEGSLQEVSETSSVNVWTNGGLLGLEPSKPPDYSMSNGEHRNSMDIAEDDVNPLTDNVALTESHVNGITRKVDSLGMTPEQTEKSQKSQVGRDRLPDMVIPNDLHSDLFSTKTDYMGRTVDNSECCASYHDKQGHNIQQENFLEHLTVVSEAGLEKSKDLCQNRAFGNVHGHVPKETRRMTSQGEVPVVAGIKTRESSQKNIQSSSSMSVLNQKFSENGNQRKEFVVQEGITRLNEPHCNSQMGKGKVVHHIIPEQYTKNQLKNGSPVNSLPPSPPLEHMKISFHPMDGFETSKLRLKFPGGHRFRESIKDVIFPSFQLLPQPALLMQDIGSDSENDTFCRSSPYSDDLTSQPSGSSSERWESDDDTADSNGHGKYDALHRVSSIGSMSSAFELEGASSSINHFDDDFRSPEPNNGIQKFRYNALYDLPSFDSVSSLGSSQQETKCDSATKDHEDSELQYPKKPIPPPPPLPPAELQYPKEPVPPPPPLPPVEWRATKPNSGVAESEQGFTSNVDNCLNDLQIVGAKLDLPTHPHSNGSSDYFLNKKDLQKLSEKREANQAEMYKDMDEREDLLHQIRSKSFNLRRTVPTTRPTFSESPTTNDKVAAIIEKAHAIRQAYVGSDEGGDESWSDT